MAKSVNKCFFIGHTGQDPGVRYTRNGDAVTTLSLATSRAAKDPNSDGWIEVTDWHRLVFFKKLAEVVGEYVGKGSQIHVEGFQRTRQWQDESRQKRYITEIVVQELTLLDTKPPGAVQPPVSSSESNQTPNSAQPSSSPPDFDGFDDDIPF